MRLHYFAVYKPYGVLSQFSGDGGHPTLAGLHDFPHDVYPAGRLDADSEGLLLLTNDKELNSRLLHPARGHARTYLVQVEGLIGPRDVNKLERGVTISLRGRPYRTKPCRARVAAPPAGLPPRIPPVRFRKTVPDSWLEITLYEGKNRQIRKMTAAVGYPALRLVRFKIESLTLSGMNPGDVTELFKSQVYALLRI